jgi:hypothetical protein
VTSHGVVVEQYGAKGHGVMLLYNGVMVCDVVLYDTSMQLSSEITKKARRQKPRRHYKFIFEILSPEVHRYDSYFKKKSKM